MTPPGLARGHIKRSRDHRSRLQLQRHRNYCGHIWRLAQKFVGRLRSIASSAQSIFSRCSIYARCLQLFARIFYDESRRSTEHLVCGAGRHLACRNAATRRDARLPHSQDACATLWESGAHSPSHFSHSAHSLRMRSRFHFSHARNVFAALRLGFIAGADLHVAFSAFT